MSTEAQLRAAAKYYVKNRESLLVKKKVYDDAHRKERANWRRHDTFDTNRSVRFIAFDGEGSNGRYQLLACSATDLDLRNRNGLGTLDCLGYFADLYERGDLGSHDALVGFGLGYDFENILRDVSDEDYGLLRSGKTVQFDRYTLRYVARKFLDCRVQRGPDDGKGYSFRLQDIYPYFQTSFVTACEQRGIVLPAIVYEGKRQRSGFKYSDIDKIALYNRAELAAMVQLAESLREDFVAAFEAIGITPSIGRNAWYGPGSQAISVLTASDPRSLRPPSMGLSVSALNVLSANYGVGSSKYKSNGALLRAYASVMQHPFTTAYFGGRIEAAMQGRFHFQLYDYDLTSAYPYAITRLPTLSDKKLIPINHLDDTKRIGVYLVWWSDTRSRPYHPFAYRSRNGNVFFPAEGYGWVLSPELYAGVAQGAIIEVIEGWVFANTEGYGDGYREGDSPLATLIRSMGEHRAQAKRDGNPAHRGLKLLMNSVYGKTLQKEGSRRFFNAFVAAWITSVTRSRIYGLIGSTEPGQVISVMTDGVLSTVPLPAILGDELGAWGLTTYEGGYQFAPGVYRLHRSDGTSLVHYRGFLRFDADKAARSLDEHVEYISSNPVFVSRVMALHDTKLRKKRYQFVPIDRKEVFSLASKRDMEAPIPVGSAIYYPAKSLGGTQSMVSWPYDAFGTNAILKVEDDTLDVE